MSESAQAPRGLLRREDLRLTTGAGRYVADMAVSGCLDAVFVRSTCAHGRLLVVDTAACGEVDGVVGAWAAADLDPLPMVPAFGPAQATQGREWAALADDRLRYVGQPVAVVLGTDRYCAEDGADEVAVHVEELPALVDPTEAADSQTRLFDTGDNVVASADFGEPIDDRVFQDAPVVVEGEYRQQRLAPNPIEARAFLAVPDGGGLRIWCSHQAPHRLHRELSAALELGQDQVRVQVPDAGGAFGAKSATFPEYLAVARLAVQLQRPVRWIEDRAESLAGATHGRGQNQRVRLAADEDGRMLALRVEIDADVGGFPHIGFVANQTGLAATGAYRTPQVHAHVRLVLTSTTPTYAYRGAGRPEAAYAVERTVDKLANRIGVDPAELRRRNFVAPGEFPYDTPTGRRYDSGEYERALDLALDTVDYSGWRAEQARERATGERALGVGLCSYVERSGADMGMTQEYGAVEVDPGGAVTALSGACSTGQGHETVFPRMVAQLLEIPEERVELVQRDTAEVMHGTGTFASRSMQIGGTALHRSAQALIDEGSHRVAELAGTDEVSYGGGVFRAGELQWTLEELAAETGKLRAEDLYEGVPAFPFGCYVAVVEVDRELGHVRVLRLVAVDDYGVVVEPAIVGGQTRGSIAQGLGQALCEGVPYDEHGQPRISGLLDYLLPTVAEIPDVHLRETCTPNPNTPVGAKGAGEAGCIGVPPAVVNAVADALGAHEDPRLQMPLTPDTCRRLAEAQFSGENTGIGESTGTGRITGTGQ